DELLERYARPLYRIEPDPGQEATTVALAASLRAVPWIDGVMEDGGRLVVSVTDEVPASEGLLPLVVAAGVRLAAFERVRPSLEDVFLRLVRRAGGGARAGWLVSCGKE